MSSLTPTHSINATREDWSLFEGARALLFAIFFPFTSLLLVSFPQKFDRSIAITLVLSSAYAAFVTSDHLSPDDTLNEVYTRYILIGGSYMLSMAYKIDPTKLIQTHVCHSQHLTTILNLIKCKVGI